MCLSAAVSSLCPFHLNLLAPQAGLRERLRGLRLQLVRGVALRVLLLRFPQSVWRESVGAVPAERTAGHGHREHELRLDRT